MITHGDIVPSRCGFAGARGEASNNLGRARSGSRGFEKGKEDGCSTVAANRQLATIGGQFRTGSESVESLERLGREIVPLPCKVQGYARLGLLQKLLHVEHPDTPSETIVTEIQKERIDTIEDERMGARDLSNRLKSKGAQEMRRALAARALMEKQWTAA
jgi:hypothetical protein